MEALKRCAISVICLGLSILLSACGIWLLTLHNSRVSYELWEKVLSLWIGLGGTASLLVAFALSVVSVLTIFIPSRKTFGEIFG